MSTYRRDELYEQVWAEPVRDVAKRYGVSDVALAKTCRRLGVPLPGRGYWAKKAAGKAPKRPPLPPLEPHIRASITVKRRAVDSDGAPPAGSPDPAVAAEIQSPIAVPKRLRTPHPLVARSAEILPGRSNYKGLLVAHNMGCLDLHVAPTSLPRALRIADALIKTLQKAGMTVEVVKRTENERHWGEPYQPPPVQGTRVLCEGEWLGFAIVEKHSKVLPPDPPSDLSARAAESWRRRRTATFKPNGLLELSITNCDLRGLRTSWKDGKRLKLESRLGEFIAQLPILAHHIAEARAEAERCRQLRIERERRQAEEAERRRHQEQREAELRNTVARWRLASDIRTYINAASRIVSDGDLSAAEEAQQLEYLEWARAYADRIDPLRELRDGMEQSLDD